MIHESDMSITAKNLPLPRRDELLKKSCRCRIGFEKNVLDVTAVIVLD